MSVKLHYMEAYTCPSYINVKAFTFPSRRSLILYLRSAYFATGRASFFKGIFKSLIQIMCDVFQFYATIP